MTRTMTTSTPRGRSLVDSRLGIGSVDRSAGDGPSAVAVALASVSRATLLRILGNMRHGRIQIEDRTAGTPRTHTVGSGTNRDMRATVVVDDPRAWIAMAFRGSIGAGTGYMQRWWTTDDLPALLRVFASEESLVSGLRRRTGWVRRPAQRLLDHLSRNTVEGARANITAHYDLGNDFFSLFLDESMTYSSAVWPDDATSLADAQRHKMHRLFDLLDLRPEHHLLEIGSGWGSLAVEAAATRGCRVTTTTISDEQHSLALKRVRAAGLSDKVTVLRRDYRDLSGTYDRLVSVEMIEAVGERYIPTFFRACGGLVAPGGRMALQAIVLPDDLYEMQGASVDFVKRFVFPGGWLPSVSSMHRAAASETDLAPVAHDDITPHYARTLSEWRSRFHAAEREVAGLGFDDVFFGLWDFYLAYCQAGFDVGRVNVVQMAWERPGR